MTTATRTPAGIDTAALRELTKDGSGPRLLDVRTPGEFHTVHIPGAYNVPLDTLREHRAELLHHLDEDTVLICRSGARAAQAEQALSETGLPNLRVLEGGMVAWEAAGGPVTRGAARWELERQVRLIAGSIVLVSGLAGLAIPGLHLIGTAVGAGLTFAAVTNTCAMGMMLAKLPYNRGPRTDINSVIAALRSRP
ncbi:rhodanese-like domain-containing protein [Kitasatospora sp. NPDC058190]|uniref:rhodanese-like domain-containing protein n=1 Tax=Kitasatospora sp. NPDC058190 TaxID=3346371 RepID=UPI0036DA7791